MLASYEMLALTDPSLASHFYRLINTLLTVAFGPTQRGSPGRLTCRFSGRYMRPKLACRAKLPLDILKNKVSLG